MSGRNIIVIGASLGGLDAIRQLVKSFPADWDASVFIVLHRWAQGPNILESILAADAKLPVKTPKGRETVKRGTIYLAPRDHHMVLDAGNVVVLFGPKQNHHRPSIDSLFSSAATVHGPRVIGVVLTGSMSDGALGLAEIKAAGGVTLVQNPEEAVCPSMPLSALQRGVVDNTLSLADMPARLVELSREKIKATRPRKNPHPICGRKTPSAMICPDCGGALEEKGDNGTMHFRCHTGHVFTLESLVGSQTENVEEALWTAVRVLEERAVLQRRLAAATKTPAFAKKAEENERHATTIERMIEKAVNKEP